ncbi:MAG: leucine-rich repeat protein, partial [Muribaculaceae bacterium]|nr:leucine-rich repeat protein [Muribaculaceae bacterium]
AFSGCTGLTSVTIPNSVTSIGKSAFYNTPWYNNKPDGVVYINNVLYQYKGTMPGGTSIDIKDGIVSISVYAFSGCTGLTSVTIPNSVTSIGVQAFLGCTGLTEVNFNAENCADMGSSPFINCTNLKTINIGNEVKTIPGYAFRGRSGLTSVVIPNSVTSIGKSAFEGCTGLTSVAIPNSVTSIGTDAFSGCSSLTKLNIEDGVESISGLSFLDSPIETLYLGRNTSDAFMQGKTSLKELTIGNTVTTIGANAFSGCTGLTSVTIGNSVTTIGSHAFSGCTGLTEVSIPNSVTSIDWYVFDGCTGLTSVTIPNSVTSIGTGAFNGCTGLTSVAIPNSVTLIGEGAFGGCTGLTEVNFNAENCAYMGSSTSPAFRNCTNLKTINIGNEVKTIPNYAFRGCSGLMSVTIGNSVNSIGEKTFEGCNKIVVVNSHNTTAPTGAPFEDVVKQSAILNVPSSAIASYQSTEGWKDFANIREMAMNGNYDFEVDGIYYRIISLTDLTAEVVAKDDTYNIYSGEVVIPESVSYRNREFKVISIDAMTFSYCSELTSLTIPQTVTTVGKLALNGCTGLKSLIIADSNTDLVTNGSFDSLAYETLYLGRKASVNFKSLTDLKVITLAGGVTFISYSAFLGCTGLTTVTIGDSVTSIDEGAFYGCTGLTSVTIGNSVTSIDEYAFAGCSNLSEVNITDLSAWCKIDFDNSSANPLSYALHLKLNGTEVTNLVIPNDITKIKQYAFYGCTGLTSVTIHNSVTSIGKSAFSGCTGLTEVSIPNSVTTIGYDVFSGCTGLTEVSIPNSVTSIGSYAFSGCSGLTEITIPNSVTTIGVSAFSGCTGLTEVSIPNSVTAIRSGAFSGCTGLKSVTIPNSVSEIGEGAFGGCTALGSLIIKEGVNPIAMDGNIFAGSSLTSIYIGRTMTNVTSPFSGITSLSKVTLGRGMTSLQSDAFAGCTGIKELVIEGGESAITIDCKFNDSPIEKLHIGRNGTYAFNNRVDLKEVSVGDNVTSLPKDAFNGCSNITSLKLGNKLETIGSGAFTGCATLMNVYSTNLTPPTGVVFDNKTYLQGTLYVVKGSKAAYEAADGWKEFWEIIDNLPFEVNGIWYNIDEYGNTKAVMNPSGDAYSGAISIPATIEYDGKVYPVTAIDAEAFANAINVTSITIEDSDQPLTIGASATEISAMSNDSTSVFGDCMLDSVYVGRNLSYQDAPFANISTLKKVTLGGKVTTMGGAMFAGCENIEMVYAMGTTPATEAEFEAKVYDHATLVVPVGTLNVYSVADGWKEFFTIQDVNGNVGVEDIVINGEDGSEPTIMVVNGEIVVNGDEDAQIAVYSINGGLIYQGINRPVAVAAKGVYVVVVNGNAVKVVI